MSPIALISQCRNQITCLSINTPVKEPKITSQEIQKRKMLRADNHPVPEKKWLKHEKHLRCKQFEILAP